MTDIPLSSGGAPAVREPQGAPELLRGAGVQRAFQIGDREIRVLHGVDIVLRRGERVSLMGTSGAGKTTLLNILGLLDRPTAGKVMVDGVDGWELTQSERARLRNQKIGFVFQFYHLLPELDAIENTMLPARIAFGRAAFRRERDALEGRAVEMLRRFGLSERLTHRPGQLSGGEQQRVAIARALMLDPPVLIADEPTGNLDTATGEKVLELLLQEQAQRRTALLLVTHDLRLAQRCERVVHMRDGRVVEGLGQDLTAEPGPAGSSNAYGAHPLG